MKVARFLGSRTALAVTATAIVTSAVYFAAYVRTVHKYDPTYVMVWPRVKYALIFWAALIVAGVIADYVMAKRKAVR